MGAIAETANEVFRDFVSDGVQSSGDNKPSKPEIRSLFGLIDELGTGGISYPSGGPMRLATAAALPSNTYSNGIDGVGGTLTATANGALTVDGKVVALNDRVLVKDEATPANNGPYSQTQIGDGSHPFVLTRLADADTSAQLGNLSVFITDGTTNIGSTFNIALGEDEIVVGTTGLVWRQTGGPGGLSTEAAARASADTTEATARAAADTSEASTRAAADTAEAATRAATDTVISSFFSQFFFADTLDQSVLLRFLDKNRKIFGEIGVDGSWNIKLTSLRQSDGFSMAFFETLDTGLGYGVLVDTNRIVLAKFPDPAIATLAAQAVTAYFFETIDPTYSTIFVDPNRKLLGAITSTAAFNTLSSEVTTARGDRADLNTRIGQGLTPYGDPIGPVWGRWNIQETRMRLRQRLCGDAAQLITAFIGDSYTQSITRYVGPLATTLQNAYGFAGLGWVSFAWWGTASGTWTSGSQPVGLDQSARADLMPVFQIIGTWTADYNNGANNAPSMSKITSSTASDYVRWGFPAGHTSSVLHYSGDGTGVVQVSWDDGATWSANINLTTVGAAHVALAGTPAGAGTARIKVISGNCALAGVDMQSTASGVVVHKIAGSGSTASQWATVTRTPWAAGIAALNPKLVVILLGTNDQGAAIAPVGFGNSISTIVANIKSVLPYSDILIAMPAENQRTTNVFPMSGYSQAAREFAVANALTFLDMQFFFGSAANFAFAYANANSARPWYASDLIHPDPNTGGRVMVDAFVRLLTLD